ncbi:hypothetical protein EVA_03741 [gut metagenome]|uniref:Uncharacterized protein n=1 Tax=gut metagenome TaxID=749906 RepID=J9GK61_9ZZZZ
MFSALAFSYTSISFFNSLSSGISFVPIVILFLSGRTASLSFSI